MNNKLIHGDSVKELIKFDDNSVDLLCTDPPYGYGFMGRDWDKVLPDINIFKECFRVLKPGSMAFVMSAPRSDVQYRMAEMLEKVGFRIDYTPIYWTYASGFPKAMNIGKMIDKQKGVKGKVVGKRKVTSSDIGQSSGWNKLDTNRGDYEYTKPASDEAKELDGSYAGFQPKPAVEVVIVAMKPLDKKGYLEQAQDNQKGITWFDDCRIPFQGEHDYPGWWETGAKGSEGYLGTDTFKIRDMSSEDIMKRRFKNKSDYEKYVEKQKSFKNAKSIGKTIKGDEHFLGGDIKQLDPSENYQKKTTTRQPRTEDSVFKTSGFKSENNDTAEASPMGRFPANLLVSDDVLDDGKKRKAVPKGGFGAMDIGIGKPGETQKYRSKDYERYVNNSKGFSERSSVKEGEVYSEAYGNEAQQWGFKKPKKKKITMPDLRDVGKKSKEAIGIDKLSFGQVENAERKEYEVWDIQEESIGYSRFFSLDEWFKKNISQLPEPVQKTFPFLIVPKASKSEKNDGLEFMEEKDSGAYVGRGGTQEDPNGMFKDRETKSRNIHPTVKPLTLMNYLVTLGSRKGDVVLEPFAGSGTTALSCVSLERDYIAIEKEEEYYEIAKARLEKVEAPLKIWEKFS